jgi:hypothetical protein
MVGELGGSREPYHFELPGGDRTRFLLKAGASFDYWIEVPHPKGKIVEVAVPVLTVEGDRMEFPTVVFTEVTEPKIIALNC